VSLHLGTSGWSYDHWRHGVVYPEGLASAKWLPFIADRFDTVELNASFYRWPKAETVAHWAAQVPDGFRFTVKLWRGFTHYRRLEDPKGDLGRFLALFDAMPEDRRGALLVQLPPQMDVDAQRLGSFLGQLDAFGWRVCVETRNASWDTPGIRALLDGHGAALCVHDMRWAGPVTKPNEAPFVYVRRHGPTSRYGGTYTDEALLADAAAIRGWVAGGRDVFVYFNNDGKGYAVRDALRLKQFLADGGPPRGARLRRPRPRSPSRRSPTRPAASGARPSRAPAARAPRSPGA